MSRARATVSWVPPEGARRRCSFDDRCDVGRDPANRIIIASPSVSRRHVVAYPDAGGVLVHNISRQQVVESSAGPVAPGARRLLAVGETFTLGEVELRIEAAPDASPRATITCVGPDCGRSVSADLSDCPWCGVSLAFALTRVR